jgi:hypothetical protein
MFEELNKAGRNLQRGVVIEFLGLCHLALDVTEFWAVKCSCSRFPDCTVPVVYPPPSLIHLTLLPSSPQTLIFYLQRIATPADGPKRLSLLYQHNATALPAPTQKLLGNILFELCISHYDVWLYPLKKVNKVW